MQQADDFLAENRAVEALIAPLNASDYTRVTGFKDWTIDQILRHLHVWNRAAGLSLADAGGFKTWINGALAAMQSGSMKAFEADECDGQAGPELFETWREYYPKLAAQFSAADPAARVPWAGPSMSARSSITARLMETWAHAQAVYDELGVERQSTDGIRNIVILGQNTYGWTFKNRGLEVPEPRPQLLLEAPSGEIWTFGEDAGEERIEGRAEAFCQVVTQTRNVADTDLKVTGPNATAWMAIAQCFAGPPNDPPLPGARKIRAVQ